MWAAIILAATAALIAALRPQRRSAVYAVLVALGAAIWVTWSPLPDPSYAWLPALHLVLAGRNDETARLAATLVATIAAVVAVFALGDPETNDGAPRFFATYALFVGAMLAFVSAGSIVFAYVCWEIMGVASFVLIGHDVADAAAGASARRALTATRLGDLSVLIGATLLATGSLEAGASFVVVGAAVKSAQLGASPWLVGAMVAPTPVSALLHSATLVAAGPYLVARFIAFPNVPVVAAALLAYAGITALTSAIFAATSDDAKRTLAWSSIEQLAQAFVAAAVGMPRLALAVLAGHAIAKPALFFAAGMQRVATGTSRYATASRAARRVPSLISAIAYGAIALVGIPPFLSSWALAGTWTAAGRVQPILLFAGVALASLGGWYVTRFGLLLLPSDERRFETRRIGAGSSIAVWLMIAVGTSVSLRYVRVAVDPISIALPLAAIAGAAACFTLRHTALVRCAPLIPSGIDDWDAAFRRTMATLAGVLDAFDRAALGVTDRLGATIVASGETADRTDRGIDRATTSGGRRVAADGTRAGSLVAGNPSLYLGISGGIFVAAALAAIVLMVVRKAVI